MFSLKCLASRMQLSTNYWMYLLTKIAKTPFTQKCVYPPQCTIVAHTSHKRMKIIKLRQFGRNRVGGTPHNKGHAKEGGWTILPLPLLEV